MRLSVTSRKSTCLRLHLISIWNPMLLKVAAISFRNLSANTNRARHCQNSYGIPKQQEPRPKPLGLSPNQSQLTAKSQKDAFFASLRSYPSSRLKTRKTFQTIDQNSYPNADTKTNFYLATSMQRTSHLGLSNRDFLTLILSALTLFSIVFCFN